MSTPTFEVERELANQGARVVIGVDEVGRGALAGDVMVGAAAFVVSENFATKPFPKHTTDSKQISYQQREALFEPLQAYCDAWGIGAATAQEIDEWGISYALGIAAIRALNVTCNSLLSQFPTILSTDNSPKITERRSLSVILDGPHDYITKNLDSFDAPLLPVRPHVVTKVKADGACVSVSAASILAKVTRDRAMIQLVQEHPEYACYGWEHNVGYGTEEHRKAIAMYGVTPYHRTSWNLVNRA